MILKIWCYFSGDLPALSILPLNPEVTEGCTGFADKRKVQKTLKIGGKWAKSAE
jgi:hypothetical protein